MRTVAIAGLGLLGGSIARDLAERGIAVLGWDHDPATLDAALAAGMLADALDADLAGAGAADVVLLALPVRSALRVLARAAPALRDVPLITDTGSTKASLLARAEALGLAAQCIGAHPLAGDHRHGWAAARTGLVRGARVFLCAAPAATPVARSLAAAFWSSLGGRPEWLDAADHDRRLAWTSHLPQAASSALAAALAAHGVALHELGPGGRDVLRLAGSSPDLWSEILLDNGAEVTAALLAAETSLGQLRRAIAEGDEATLLALLGGAREWANGPARA